MCCSHFALVRRYLLSLLIVTCSDQSLATVVRGKDHTQYWRSTEQPNGSETTRLEMSGMSCYSIQALRALGISELMFHPHV